MTYTKPEIVVLGAAARVIEVIPPVKANSPLDANFTQLTTVSAYDLDE